MFFQRGLSHPLRLVTSFCQVCPVKYLHKHDHCVYTAGYRILRFYWSMRHVNKRCSYYCSIAEVDGRPEFVIEVEENGHETMEFRNGWQCLLFVFLSCLKQCCGAASFLSGSGSGIPRSRSPLRPNWVGSGSRQKKAAPAPYAKIFSF